MLQKLFTALGIFTGTLASMSCHGIHPPTESGGVLIPGTDDVQPRGELNFTISPDGRWLFFRSSRGSSFDPTFVLIDLERQQRKEIGFSDEARRLAADGRGPVTSGWRWSRDGSTIVLRSEAAFFTARVADPSPVWSIGKDLEESGPKTGGTSPHDPLAVALQPSENVALLVDAQESSVVLARYQEPPGASVRIVHVNPAPNGAFVSYLVESYVAAFPSPTRGFVIARDRNRWTRPVEIAAPVYGPIRWSPIASELYACTHRGRGSTGIYRWSNDDLRKLIQIQSREKHHDRSSFASHVPS
jgi:hypothetical protein